MLTNDQIYEIIHAIDGLEFVDLSEHESRLKLYATALCAIAIACGVDRQTLLEKFDRYSREVWEWPGAPGPSPGADTGLTHPGENDG